MLKMFRENNSELFNSELFNCSSFLGTWIIDEVKKAIKKRYKIIEIYKVCHFKEKNNHSFKEYMNDFMKIKLEASPRKDNYKSK